MGNAAQYNINIGGNAPAYSKETAAALADLQGRAAKSQETIKSLNATLRTLRGSSEEVKGAKDKLKAALDAEKSALSAATLEALKHGTTLEDLGKKTKTASASSGDFAKGVKLAGGPLAEVQAKAVALGEAFGGANVATVALVGSFALLTAGAFALAGGVLAGATALARFVVTAGDAQRSLALSREGIAGSAADSARMGDQIDRLRQKIPLTVEAFSDLYKQVRTTFDGSRVSGQGILDVVTVLAATQAAMGNAAASKLEAIAERGKNLGRLRIGSGFDPFSGGPGGKGELTGTGVAFEDVAAALAKNTGKSMAEARLALNRGTVSYVEGIKALREATDKAFGEINAKKMLSLDVQARKFHDDLANLTRGVDLTPFLQVVQRLGSLFSSTSTSGYGLKTIFEALGISINQTAKGSAPLLELAIRKLILEATRFSIRVVDWEIQLKKMGKLEIVSSLKEAYEWATKIYGALASTVEVLGKIRGGVTEYRSPAQIQRDEEAAGRAGSSAGGAERLSSGPRASFSGGGKSTVVAPAHAAGGMVVQPPPGEAFAAVKPGEYIVPAGGGRGGGSGTRVYLTVAQGAVQVVVPAGPTGRATAEAVGARMLPDLTKAIEDLFKGAGIPTQTAG